MLNFPLFSMESSCLSVLLLKCLRCCDRPVRRRSLCEIIARMFRKASASERSMRARHRHTCQMRQIVTPETSQQNENRKKMELQNSLVWKCGAASSVIALVEEVRDYMKDWLWLSVFYRVYGFDALKKKTHDFFLYPINTVALWRKIEVVRECCLSCHLEESFFLFQVCVSSNYHANPGLQENAVSMYERGLNLIMEAEKAKNAKKSELYKHLMEAKPSVMNR